MVLRSRDRRKHLAIINGRTTLKPDNMTHESKLWENVSISSKTPQWGPLHRIPFTCRLLANVEIHIWVTRHFVCFITKTSQTSIASLFYSFFSPSLVSIARHNFHHSHRFHRDVHVFVIIVLSFLFFLLFVLFSLQATVHDELIIIIALDSKRPLPYLVFNFMAH